MIFVMMNWKKDPAKRSQLLVERLQKTNPCRNLTQLPQ